MDLTDPASSRFAARQHLQESGSSAILITSRIGKAYIGLRTGAGRKSSVKCRTRACDSLAPAAMDLSSLLVQTLTGLGGSQMPRMRSRLGPLWWFPYA